MASDKTEEKQSGLIPWKPGQSGNPKGRPKGSRNALGEAFLKALHEDFDAYGVEAIVRARTEDPVAYVKTIAGLLPKEMNLTVNPVEELTDDELIERIQQLDAAINTALRGTGKVIDGVAIEAGSKGLPALRTAAAQDTDQNWRN